MATICNSKLTGKKKNSSQFTVSQQATVQIKKNSACEQASQQATTSGHKPTTSQPQVSSQQPQAHNSNTSSFQFTSPNTDIQWAGRQRTGVGWAASISDSDIQWAGAGISSGIFLPKYGNREYGRENPLTDSVPVPA